MKKPIVLISVLYFSLFMLNSQDIELAFTGMDNDQWVQLDSIKILNLTRDVDTLLHWPDTSVIFYHVGSDENPFNSANNRNSGTPQSGK